MTKIEWHESGGYDVAIDEQGQSWRLLWDDDVDGKHVAVIEREGKIAMVINCVMIASA